MTTQLDVLIAAALERERLEERERERQEAAEREQLASQHLHWLRAALDLVFTPELSRTLDWHIDANSNGAWAHFQYGGRTFTIDITGDITGEDELLWVYLTRPIDGRTEIGEFSALQEWRNRPLDEHLLRELGHWRKRHGFEEHAAEAPEEPTEEVLADIPF